MGILDRLLGRAPTPDRPADDDADPEPDELVERWALGAYDVAAGLGPRGRFAVAVLGESLAGGCASPWLGREPSGPGLAELLSALGEESSAAGILMDLEAPLSDRRPGAVSSATRDRWRDLLETAAQDAVDLLPERDPLHVEAERVWREAAAAIQEWRVVRLDPDAALGQVRWFPGCETRASYGYADPLGIANMWRAVQEHRWSAGEWQALESAELVADRLEDPLRWRLSSLSFAAQALAGR